MISSYDFKFCDGLETLNRRHVRSFSQMDMCHREVQNQWSRRQTVVFVYRQDDVILDLHVPRVHFPTVGVILAKSHVRVRKQSCKQGNRLILWGVRAPRHFFFLDFFSIFFSFFFSKNLKKYDFTRPKVSKYSLTS
jgi:hypothetical protein